MQAQISGALGGTTVNDECFYAFQGHTSNNTYYYNIMVRDLVGTYSDEATQIPSTRDFSGTQRYRFCVEKIANTCLEPVCMIFENGCGQP